MAARVVENYQPAPDLLKDRVILVTGAGDGIGRAAALTYAQHGATVILLGRTIKKLEAVYDEIENAGCPQPAIIPLNLEGATLRDYDETAMQIDETFGRLDGLLHNAGILGQRTPIELYDPETWNQVLQVNLTSHFMMTQSFIPLLRKSGSASMIFTSSSVGRQGRAHWGAYAISKAGIESLMQVLADELDDTRNNIRVNSLNPGATRTQMRRLAYSGEHPENNPRPEEIMDAYLYLMGPDSEGVTGEQFDAQKK